MSCHHLQRSKKIAVIVYSIFGPLLNLFIAHRGWVVCPYVNALDASIESDTISKFKQPEKKLVFFDYDGTLAPFVEDPEEATPSEALSEVLVRLNDDPTARVAIISGRDKPFLDKHFAKYENLHLAAEYGASQRKPGGQWVDDQGLELNWQPQVINLMKEEHNKYTKPFHELLRVEKKITGVVLHYRKLYNRVKESPELAKSLKLDNTEKAEILKPFFERLKALNQEGNLGSKELIVENDNLAIEVRMGKRLSKGKVVKQLLESNSDTKMALCFGDSNADEAMFTTLKLSGPSELAMFHVQNNKHLDTTATHKLAEPQQAVDLLRKFYDMAPKKIEPREAS